MANVNHTLTLTSSDLTTDPISVTILNTIAGATKGGISRIPLATTAISGATVLATAAQWPTAGAKCWFYNPATFNGSAATDIITVSFNEAADHVVLKGGDWAIVPWMGNVNSVPKNIEAYGSTGAMTIEFGIFQ